MVVVIYYHFFFLEFIIVNKTSIQRYLINSTLIRKLLFPDKKKKKSKLYLERFHEYRQSTMERNIVVQLLPILLVLALLYILSTQNLFFGTVLSGSMEPAFKRGDLVLMQSLYGKPGIGDIIMFVPQEGMEPVTHRIISIDKYGYIKTKGDANQKEDDWILKSNVNMVGKSVMIGGKPVVIPGLGSVLVSRADNFSIILTKNKGITPFIQEFRTLTPLIIFFMLILYMFMFVETRSEEKDRFGKTGRKKS